MYPAPARPGFGWKLLQSSWVLISILGFGCFSGAGLVLVGLRARKPAWWGSGVGYLLIGTGMIVAFQRTSDPDDSSSGGAFAGLWLLIWVACIVHSFVLNVFWLRWQEQRHLAAQGQAYGSPAAFGSPVAFGSTVSSGFPAYDQKIQREMRNWKYRPFMVNGKAAPVCTAVTFIYQQKS